ncbi:MAG: arsenate reductase ArsC [Marinicellaceae bacterium]
MKILFICTHNRCRSILGEAITRKLCDESIHVRSAGSAPAGKVHPETLRNLARHGYDTQDLISNSWDDLGDFVPDITITVCDNAAKEACPLWLGKAIKIHWGLPDPTHADITAEDRPKVFDSVINTLENRIKKMSQLSIENKTYTEINNIFNQAGEIN